MNQTQLFDSPANPLPCRSSDPATAKRAARDLPIRLRQAEVVLALRRLMISATADEVRAALRVLDVA